MGELIYGRKALKHPTPAGMAFWCRVYTIVGGSLMIATKTAPFLDTGSIAQQSIEWFFTTTITVANLLLPLVGVNVKEETVPVEKVTSIETETKS